MIPLSVPNLNGNEWKYIKDCLDTNWVSSVGAYVDKFEQSVVEFTGSKFAVATSNGTSALHISLLLSEVKASDYVIVPNITFVASINSIKYTGADPILIDIDPQTWQMDLDLLEEFLQQNTSIVDGQCIYKLDNRIIKAIMPVHVLGNMCNVLRLQSLAKAYCLVIIEDATEALGSYYNKIHAGTFGTLGCFSFNGNKIITTGGGGMIITNDTELAKRAKHLTTQAKADSFEYIHDEIGYNYRLVNILAAMGVAQMEQLPAILDRKKEIAETYNYLLHNIEDISFQATEDQVSPNHWLFTIRSNKQPILLQELNKNKIQSRPFWVPMNQLKMFNKDIYVSKYGHSEAIYKSCLSLPCSSNITTDEIQFICNFIKKIYTQSVVSKQ